MCVCHLSVIKCRWCGTVIFGAFRKDGHSSVRQATIAPKCPVAMVGLVDWADMEDKMARISVPMLYYSERQRPTLPKV